jgi:uncharacterized membrane protein YidH (DUF202 family)
MAKERKMREAAEKYKREIPMFEGAQLWKILLIVAVIVPAIVTLIIWYQAGFEKPMPKEVFDRVAQSPIVFSAFIGLVAASFWLHYKALPKERRNKETIRKTPILIFMGIGVVIFSGVLLWWQNPDITTKEVILEIARKPFLVGSALILIFGGLSLIFLLSSKDEQRRALRITLMLISAFLVFGGPTYFILILQTAGIPYLLLILMGLFSFTLGLILLTRFIKEEERKTRSPA